VVVFKGYRNVKEFEPEFKLSAVEPLEISDIEQIKFIDMPSIETFEIVGLTHTESDQLVITWPDGAERMIDHIRDLNIDTSVMRFVSDMNKSRDILTVEFREPVIIEVNADEYSATVTAETIPEYSEEFILSASDELFESPQVRERIRALVYDYLNDVGFAPTTEIVEHLNTYSKSGISNAILSRLLHDSPEFVDVSSVKIRGNNVKVWEIRELPEPKPKIPEYAEEFVLMHTDDNGNDTMFHLTEYLKAISKFREDHKPEGWKYGSPEEFVLKNGQPFKPIPIPDDLYCGEMKMCFQNAARAAGYTGKYRYAEGYALQPGLIPTNHAWIVDENDNAIDLTWKYNPDTTYYGIIFDTKYLWKVLAEKETYGIIDNWKMGFPLLRGEEYFTANIQRIQGEEYY